MGGEGESGEGERRREMGERGGGRERAKERQGVPNVIHKHALYAVFQLPKASRTAPDAASRWG